MLANQQLKATVVVVTLPAGVRVMETALLRMVMPVTLYPTLQQQQQALLCLRQARQTSAPQLLQVMCMLCRRLWQVLLRVTTWCSWAAQPAALLPP
jgi:hypothetical protein